MANNEFAKRQLEKIYNSQKISYFEQENSELVTENTQALVIAKGNK